MPVKQKSAGIRLEAPVLRRFFTANGIEPTEFCCEALNWASYMSGYKLQRRLELSCTSIFLACMLLGPAASRAATKGGLL